MHVGEPGVLCKLDIEKAYDHVNLDFLLYWLGDVVLERNCVFGYRTVFFSVRFSILVNNTLSKFFCISRGLR
jgi:hypothetical protein